MQPRRARKVPVDDFASGGRPFQQLNQNQTGEIAGFSCVNGIFEGELADARYKLSQRSVEPAIATVCCHVAYPYHSKNAVDRRSFSPRLSCDVLELFLDLLPVHHVPPMGNVFGSLVMVLEIIRVFPNIET